MAIPGLKTKKCGPDLFGCREDICPDYIVRRNDSRPPVRLSLSTCDGPLDLTEEGLLVEANMWALARLKRDVTSEGTIIEFADRVGFYQVRPSDVIVVDHVRGPEHLLVDCIDEENYQVHVIRGHHATTAKSIKKGTYLRIFKFMDSSASIDLTKGPVIQEDGTVKKDQLLDTSLIYDWKSGDTCMPGCYYFEFKVMKLKEAADPEDSVNYPSTCSYAVPFNCGFGEQIEWIRRFPSSGEGLLVRVEDSPTLEV